MQTLLVNYKQYLNNEYYGTCAYAIAAEIESLMAQLSWANDSEIDSLRNALDNARYALFKTVGDSCLID
jgi:hypothetical protein